MPLLVVRLPRRLGRGIVSERAGTGALTVLVADCKYKRLEPDQFRHHDVYQLLAYCTASNVQRGLQQWRVGPVGRGGDDPLNPAAQRGRRAGLVSDAVIGAAEDQHLDQLVEDDPVRDARAMAAERVDHPA